MYIVLGIYEHRMHINVYYIILQLSLDTVIVTSQQEIKGHLLRSGTHSQLQ